MIEKLGEGAQQKNDWRKEINYLVLSKLGSISLTTVKKGWMQRKTLIQTTLSLKQIGFQRLLDFPILQSWEKKVQRWHIVKEWLILGPIFHFLKSWSTMDLITNTNAAGNRSRRMP